MTGWFVRSLADHDTHRGIYSPPRAASTPDAESDSHRYPSACTATASPSPAHHQTPTRFAPPANDHPTTT